MARWLFHHTNVFIIALITIPSDSNAQKPHKRDGICTMDSKPCVRMCCPRGQYSIRSSSGSENICVEDDGVFNMSVSVWDGDKSVAGNLFDFFDHVVRKPCKDIVVMQSNVNERDDTWVVLKNGSISIGKPSIRIRDENHFCFGAMRSNGRFKTVLMVCSIPVIDTTKNFWLSCVATIAVYTILPELRNLHGKSLVCYLSGLTVGYMNLGLIKLSGEAIAEPNLCRTIGYTTYFAFLFAFFWLNVISFDLLRSFWFIFRSRKPNDSKKFVYYSIYACGSTLLMLSMSLGVEYSERVPTKFKPGIGISDCFLGFSRWSSFLYLYLPLILISISNLTFFVLTSWKIKAAQKEMEKFTNTEESEIYRQNLEKGKSDHSLFMRMFVLMGITWFMEPISWIISSKGAYFLPTDLMNAAQGIIIFFLFVWRVNVRKLIVKRWQIWRRKVEPRRNIQPRRRATKAENSDTMVTTINDNIELQMTSNNNDL